MSTRNNNGTLHYRSSKNHISGTSNVVYPSSSNSKRTSQHQPQFLLEIEAIKQQHKNLKRERCQNDIEKALLAQISQWEKESIAYIQLAAKNARNDLNQQTKILNSRLANSINQLDVELGSNLKNRKCTNTDIKRCKSLLETCECDLQQMSAIKINAGNLSLIPLIKIENTNMIRKGTISSSSEAVIRPNINDRKPVEHAVRSRRELLTPQITPILSQQYLYPSVSFGVSESSQLQIYQLFKHLKSLLPMDKYGSMSGDCDSETTQMENFLSKTFGFKKIHGEYIVQGVKSFRLDKPLQSMQENLVIRFPSKTATDTFSMTVSEIIQWQKSYAVYADRKVDGMSKEFLLRALQGLSKYGEEAFRMKFVARISQCPILMEFDAKIIHREVNETWPQNIKLVSVTGIDFAGRIHDLNDITTYVSNWEDVYEIDPRSGLPLVYHSRDFRRLDNGPRGQLDEQRLFHDLIRMTRIRLEACDLEGVQIVVETGIGLGVFAGKGIGIDDRVRTLSALAIRTVLEQDGKFYKNILGIVFALPVFDTDHRNNQKQDTYHAFAEEFDRNRYQGRIPVLIADQDMHRLTVAVARQGFIVSELNPADSHGVFGEYWQNRGPAVEEKLALTTVGLLVQHHLINPHVLDPNHYHLI